VPVPVVQDLPAQHERLKSDMAERSHSIHLIRRLPELGGQLLRSTFELAFTTAGIIWLDPASAPLALLSAIAALSIPILAQPLLIERDLRLRTHSGALSHFYLDAFLGLVAIHTHGAQPAVRGEDPSARARDKSERIVRGGKRLRGRTRRNRDRRGCLGRENALGRVNRSVV